MMKSLIAAVMALAFASSALACSCLPPRPLGQCNVNDQQAAILVKVLDRKEFQCPTDPGIISFGGTALSTV